MKIKPKYLISIKEPFYNAIKKRQKFHEFRKVFVDEKEPFHALMYVSKPVGAICGMIKFDTPIKGNLDKMLALRSTHTFGDDNSLLNYFMNKTECIALPVKEVINFKNKTTLEELRKKDKSFRPPQSFMRINNEKYSFIIKQIEQKNKEL